VAKLKIDKEKCKGCGLCVIACSKNLITMAGPINRLGLKTAKHKRSKECTGCALCAIMCPDCVIEVWR
jgi:2-oxoglutarate ferredoxin oxidoreductase subunit delta